MKGKINELPDIDTSKYNIDENGNVLRDKRMSENEYELTIVFKSETPFYEIRSFIVNDLLDNFNNLQMWDFKRKKDGIISKLKQENEQLKQQIEKMKRCVNCKYYEPGNRADNDCSQCSIMFCQCQLDKHWCEAHDEGCKFWELAE